MEPLAEPLDALRVGDVELLGLQREAPALGQLLSGALGCGGVARGEDHVMSGLRQLPCHLASDASIRAADQGHGPLGVHGRQTTPP